MPQAEKTFKISCAHCGKFFTVRFPLCRPEDPADPQKSEKVVNCLHCGKPVIIKIPVAYVEEQDHLMGIDSLPKEI
jgi:hypothetical protein